MTYRGDSGCLMDLAAMRLADSVCMVRVSSRKPTKVVKVIELGILAQSELPMGIAGEPVNTTSVYSSNPKLYIH